jgi:tetratricopeptide (TPR) repeat protein
VLPLLALVLAATAHTRPSLAQDGAVSLPDGERLLAAGKYEDAAAAARAALHESDSVGWRLLLVRALTATGQRQPALREAIAVVERHPSSLEGLKLAHDVFRAAGDRQRAGATLQKLRAAASAPGAAITDPRELVAAGEAALLAGDEPKTVLSTYFQEAERLDPKCKATYLAGGTLALDKHDDALGAEWFRRGLGKLGPDADLQAALARAFYNGDRKEMLSALDAALHLNPRHVPALLLRAEHAIDSEDYPGARDTLAKVFKIDGGEPSAWAFEAVLAHLRHDPKGEQAARARALAAGPNNPTVDSLIGRKLTEKYRFVEGAAYQRRALAFDPQFLPAKAQLAHGLLRSARPDLEKEGWALAAEVHTRDGYDVAAYNLTNLRDNLSKFARLEKRGFSVRMDKREARLYGDDVLALLEEASGQLDRKYEFVRKGPVGVEIFPDQADFAVRTFGVPGGGNYLGVCFGSLITMNSPAGNGAVGVNWRSILWHEYAHVVTLGLTGHRIPRWLSEGISVHEELARDRNWGQRMTARYRRMILDGELHPVAKLSGAFLNPRTSEHLAFAYYQSALVVGFLVKRYGHQSLRAILSDLGAGRELNQALEARAAPMAELEKAFAAHARAEAEAFAPGADFSEPDPAALRAKDDSGEGLGASLARFRARHGNNVFALIEEARRHMQRGEWKQAQPLLEKVLALAPDSRGPDSPYLMLAEVHRKLGQTAQERKVLEQLAGIAADSAPAYRRLIELAEAGKDLPALGLNAERLLAVNPTAEAGWRGLGRAAESRLTTAPGDAAVRARAVAAYEKLLLLEPADQAETRLRLARLLQRDRPKVARRHLLDALAEAPRLREGYQLLLELGGGRRSAEAPLP